MALLSPHLDKAIQGALVELGAAHDGALVHHPRPHHVHGVGGDGPRQPAREAGTAEPKSGQGRPWMWPLPLRQAQNTSHWALARAFSNERELHYLLLPGKGAAAGPCRAQGREMLSSANPDPTEPTAGSTRHW